MQSGINAKGQWGSHNNNQLSQISKHSVNFTPDLDFNRRWGTGSHEVWLWDRNGLELFFRRSWDGGQHLAGGHPSTDQLNLCSKAMAWEIIIQTVYWCRVIRTRHGIGQKKRSEREDPKGIHALGGWGNHNVLCWSTFEVQWPWTLCWSCCDLGS